MAACRDELAADHVIQLVLIARLGLGLVSDGEYAQRSVQPPQLLLRTLEVGDVMTHDHPPVHLPGVGEQWPEEQAVCMSHVVDRADRGLPLERPFVCAKVKAERTGLEDLVDHPPLHAGCFETHRLEPNTFCQGEPKVSIVEQDHAVRKVPHQISIPRLRPPQALHDLLLLGDVLDESYAELQPARVVAHGRPRDPDPYDLAAIGEQPSLQGMYVSMADEPFIIAPLVSLHVLRRDEVHVVLPFQLPFAIAHHVAERLIDLHDVPFDIDHDDAYGVGVEHRAKLRPALRDRLPCSDRIGLFQEAPRSDRGAVVQPARSGDELHS